MANLKNKLDTLIDLIRPREPAINNLLPGLTKEKIKSITNSLPFELPEEIYQLYQWRNGIDIDSNQEIPFLFRDHYLSNLEKAVENYQIFLGSSSDLVEEYRDVIDWEKCFPFAELEDSLMLIVCGNHKFIEKHKNPIMVIHEDVGIEYYSFEKMLDTCIEWNQQSFNKYGIPENEEEIWKKHNPGIFNIELFD